MTPPNAATTTNAHDEIRAMRPTAIIPVIEDSESEEEPSVNQNGEEEVPPADEPEEAPLAEETNESTEEDSDSSIAPPMSPPSPPVEQNNPPPNLPLPGAEPPNTFHVGESSHEMFRQQRADFYSGFAPRQRTRSPERVPYYTAPAMYSLSGDPYRMPTPPTNPQYNPDYNLQIHRELQTMRTQQRDLLERQRFLEEISVIESERTRLRLDGFENELIRLRSIVRGLSARLNRLEDVNPGRRM